MKDDTIKILEEKLKPAHISKRSKGSTSLSYIESHHAIREANRAFGFDGWSYDIVELSKVSEEKNANGNHVIGYIARVVVTVGDITREDVGFGSGIAKMLADAHEGATKEAVSDAMKRSLRTFGDIFGLALYDKKQEHVEKEQPKQQPTKTFSQKMQAAKKAVGEEFYNDCLKGYGCECIADIKPEQQEDILNDLRNQRDKVRESQQHR